MNALPGRMSLHVKVDGDCLTWTGAVQSRGYGSTTNGRGGSMLAHRRAWMAARIGKSVDWIEHHMRQVPHIRVGRTPYFTERLAREYLEALTVRPASGQTSRSRGARRSR